MIWRIMVLALLCSLGSPIRAETTLALGRAISQIDDVDIEEAPEERCPPDRICLRSWARWTLHIETTIAGPQLEGRTYVVMMQHAPMVDAIFKRQLLFVLEHIDDASERKRLHADYKLLELRYPELMFCTGGDPSRWKIPPDRVYSRDDDGETTFCFPDPRNGGE
jgi:hypothetical protein